MDASIWELNRQECRRISSDMGLTNSISGKLATPVYSTYENKLEKEVLASPVPKHP